MPPLRLKLKEDLTNLNEIAKEIAGLLSRNLVGAIPTETFYGLAADPFSEEALQRLFLLKGRPENKPILLLIADLRQLYDLVKEIPPISKKLMEKFWPGPLTIVFPAKDSLSPLLTAKTNTIGVRLSSSTVVRELVKAFGKPVTGTSANLSGQPPCKSPEEVLKALPQIDFILDFGVLRAKEPSTVVSVVNNQLVLIREGAIPFEEILVLLKESPSIPLRN